MERDAVAHSTSAPARQRRMVRPLQADSINRAVDALLTRSDPAEAPVVEGHSSRLADEFAAARNVWLDAVKASRLPTARYHRYLRASQLRGGPTLADAEAAHALPGVRSAFITEEDAYIAVSDLALAIHARPVHSPDDLALVASAASVLIWPNGRYGSDAHLGDHEDVDKRATRTLIEACLRFAKRNGSSPEAHHAILEDSALQIAIQRHRSADAALDKAAVAADPIRIRNAGGDTSVHTMAPLEDAEDAADLEAAQSWRALFRVRPNTVTGLLLLLRHAAEHYESQQGIDNPPDVFGSLIGAVEGLRLAEMPAAAAHDLTRLSIAELDHLACVANHARETLLAEEQTAFCFDQAKSSLTLFGQIIEIEGDRLTFLRDHAVNEVARRRPNGKDETDRRLEVMVRQHLLCNGYIEPELMTEVVEAWGAR